MDTVDGALPDFICIGAVKAGTSWLHRKLRLHPQVFMPLKKPVGYFDRHRDKPVQRYAELFAAGRGRLVGEITANYAAMDKTGQLRMGELLQRQLPWPGARTNRRPQPGQS